MTKLSPKQKEFLLGKLARINLLYGSVRSGKTWISLLKWAVWVGTQPITSEYLMVGKTLTTLKRNCLGLLQTMIGDNLWYSVSQKKAVIFGRTVWLEGANDNRSENKIRGMTLKGIYIDELTLIPKDFYMMALSRLSEKDAVFLATTNPDVPSHYTNTDIILNEEINKQAVKFLIDDNIFLDEEYKENLKKEYTGVFYTRFIEGNYCVAEGAIYNLFAEHKEKYITKTPKYDFITVGVDFGGNNSAHAFTATGLKNNNSNLTVLATKRIKAKGTSPEDLERDFGEFLNFVANKYGPVREIYADSAEQVLINGLKKKYPNKLIFNALKKPIIDRIRGTTALMAQGRFFITEDCESLSKAFENAVYDSKALSDTRLDNGTSDIDSLDSFEYSFEKYINLYIKYGKKEE